MEQVQSSMEVRQRIMRNCAHVIKVRDKGLDELLAYETPSCELYSESGELECRVYTFLLGRGIFYGICMGHKTFGTITADNKIVNRYENEAAMAIRSIKSSKEMDYCRRQMPSIIAKFIEECVRGYQESKHVGSEYAVPKNPSLDRII